MARSLVISEIFHVKNIATPSMVNEGHLKWYHSKEGIWFPVSVL